METAEWKGSSLVITVHHLCNAKRSKTLDVIQKRNLLRLSVFLIFFFQFSRSAWILRGSGSGKFLHLLPNTMSYLEFNYKETLHSAEKWQYDKSEHIKAQMKQFYVRHHGEMPNTLCFSH